MSRSCVLAFVLLGVLVGLCGASRSAAATCQGQSATLTVTGAGILTVSTTAIGFPAASIVNASLVTFYVHTAPLAYTIAGDTPSPSVGFPGPVGLIQEVCGRAAITAFRAIRTTGVDAKIYATYWKSP